jgi:RimJ/RimL family protein N-acetyltransferase
MPQQQRPPVSIRPWLEQDFPVLERLMADPAKTGTGALDQARTRHERYLQSGETSRQGPMFAITLGPDGQAVGTIGYWQRLWQGQHLWEVGWSVLPEFQGRGIAARAIELLADRARALGRFRFLHAFPAVDNEAANNICRTAGFELLGQIELSLPAGHTLCRNDWRLNLLKGID